jgi:hypothetical protein
MATSADHKVDLLVVGAKITSILHVPYYDLHIGNFHYKYFMQKFLTTVLTFTFERYVSQTRDLIIPCCQCSVYLVFIHKSWK